MNASELSWRTSSFSGANGQCVEVADLADGGAAVRDTKARGAGPLAFEPGAWDAFLSGAAAGGFDR